MSEPAADLQVSIRRLVEFLAGPLPGLETPGGGQVFLFAQGSAVMEPRLGGHPRPRARPGP